MIGRDRAVDVLHGAVTTVAAGGSVGLLVAGEPGLGKTTTLAVLAEVAADAGLAVGSGRGVLEGAAPLWPWTSALASLQAYGPDAPGEADERPVPAPGRPAPGTTGGDAPAPWAAAARFEVFERFAAALRGRAAAGPYALILDDLQWAELTSLRLFRHLLDGSLPPGVLLAAGLRTTEPLADDTADALGALLGHPAVDVLELAGLAEGDIAAFAAERLGRRLSPAEVAVLAQRSGGNPFFLGELLRWLPKDGSPPELRAALPLAVRESVRRRLAVEDPLTQHVVRAAAIAGSAASLDLLGRIAGLDPVALAGAVDRAEKAAFVVLEHDRRGTVTFVHDLTRQAVASLLTTWDRFELHRAVGLALRDDVRSASWTAVAAHLLAARRLVDDATLADAVGRAAAEATAAGAFDEAAEHLAVALELADAAPDSAAQGKLLLQRGQALWAAERPEESKATLAEAAARARRHGDAELLGLVALAWRGGELRAIFHNPDEQFLALVREALATLPPEDSLIRCRLLSAWARCGFWDITDPEALATGDEAVAMARRLGDAEALVDALGTRFYYRWRPELLDERVAVADEIRAVAATHDDAGTFVHASYFRLVALLERGWLRDAWRELERFEAAAARSGQPTWRVRALWFRAAQALAIGHHADAEDLGARATQLAERIGRPDAAIEGLGLAVLLWAVGDRVDDALDILSPGFLDPVAHQCGVALVNGLAGRAAEAAVALEHVMALGTDRIPRDMSWTFGFCGLLVAATVAGDRAAGQHLYDALRPLAGQWAVLNPGVMLVGTVDHYLGLGAALLGRDDEAAEHLRTAAARHEREGAVALALLSLHELATVLARMAPNSAERAAVDERIARLAPANTVPFKPLLGLARPPAGQASLSRDTPPEPAAPPLHPAAPPPRQRLVPDGDTWVIEFAGSTARLRDQRGLHHLRALLARPGVEVPALTLAGGDATLTPSHEAPLLDERALREYRQRITDLQADIDEASAHHDLERAARAEAELDALVEHLAAASGVGGRRRRFSGPDERARVSVTKVLRTAIANVSEHLPDLGHHLTATVHTGHRCVYRPDPRAAQPWETEHR